MAGKLVVALIILGVAVVIIMLRRKATDAEPESMGLDAEWRDPTDDLPERFKTEEDVPAPDFTAAAATPDFRRAVEDAAALWGSQAIPMLATRGESHEIPGGVAFEVPQDQVEAKLKQAHDDFAARGAFLFRFDRRFNIEGRPDLVGLLPTTDPFEVMAAMGTSGGNYGIGSANVIAWMKELQAEQPFVLTGVAGDALEGRFTTPVRDPAGLAKRMYAFCPDIVDQGVESVEALADELKQGGIYFWWD